MSEYHVVLAEIADLWADYEETQPKTIGRITTKNTLYKKIKELHDLGEATGITSKLSVEFEPLLNAARAKRAEQNRPPTPLEELMRLLDASNEKGAILREQLEREIRAEWEVRGPTLHLSSRPQYKIRVATARVCRTFESVCLSLGN